MKTKNILFLYPFKFRKFDWYRFECDLLEKEYNIKIHIHEVINIIYPHFKKAYLSEMVTSNITEFNTLNEWKVKFEELIQEDPNILIMNHVKPVNFKALKICTYIKKFKVRDYIYASAQMPDKNIKINLSNIFKKVAWFIYNPRPLGFFIQDKLFHLLGKILGIYPKYALKSGTDHFLGSKKSEVIKANSHDFSNFMIVKKKLDQTENVRNKILYLEKPGPMFSGDNLITKKKMSEMFTVEQWYPALIKFFDKLENYMSTKIYIAPHPKTKHEKFPKYYGGREVISERLAKASFSAKMLVSIDSTGLSFGVLQNIPIIMIYSDELDQNKIFRTKQNYHAHQLGVSPININNNFNEEAIKKNLIINKDKYFNFKYKYLTSRNDFKTNYQILSDINAHK